MSCKYCRDGGFFRDASGMFDVYVDCSAGTVDVNVDWSGGGGVTFTANCCPVCGADLQKVAEGSAFDFSVEEARRMRDMLARICSDDIDYEELGRLARDLGIPYGA